MFLKPTASVPSTVQLLKVPEVGVPSTGVTKVGLVANTLFPLPVLVTETRFLDASVATALEAVRPVKFTPVVVKTPVDGLNCNLVDATLAVVMLPVVASVKVK